MAVTFARAIFAEFSAFCKQMVGVLRTAGKKTRHESAEFCAINVQPYAPRQHVYIFLIEAGGSTMTTFHCAPVKRFQ